MKKTIVIYPGRFQPFGPHHFKTYQWLVQRFGVQNVFIASSNHTDTNSPLSFEEKKLCISKYSVMQENVVQVKNPYKSEEILSKFDPNTDSVIFAYGEKDFGRIQFFKKDGSESYFKEYYGQKDLQPFSKSGYALEMPHVSVKVGVNEIDGTFLRRTLPLTKRDEFQHIMGYYDEQIHLMFKKRFHPDITEMVEGVLYEGSDRITKTALQRIEQYADKLFKEFGIDINFQDLSKNTHFYQRLNDPRNGEPISTDELRQLFKKASTRYGHKLGSSNDKYEAILKDMETDINLPFIIKWDKENKELDLIPKTVMRKSDFKSSSQLLTMEEFKNVFQNKGKFSKHIIHPFEDDELTIDELSQFVNDVLVDTENCTCSVKLDGHNFQVTYKNGQVLASRNKGTIVSPMTVDEVFKKFEGKPDVQFTFTNAHKAISEQLSKFDHQTLTDVFNNGTTFLNFEICHPRARNVFDYGKNPFLSLHSLITYDEKGNEISRTMEVPDEFQSEGSVNGFIIKKSEYVKLQPIPSLASKFQSELKEIDFPNDKVKSKHFIFSLGNAVISNFCKTTGQSYGNKTTLTKIITHTRTLCKTPEDKANFKGAYENLNRLGGIESINPIEGLVIEWRGKMYKLTGSFGTLIPIFRIYNADRYKKVN